MPLPSALLSGAETLCGCCRSQEVGALNKLCGIVTSEGELDPQIIFYALDVIELYVQSEVSSQLLARAAASCTALLSRSTCCGTAAQVAMCHATGRSEG